MNFRALLRNPEDQLEDAPFNWLRQFKDSIPTPLIAAAWRTYTDLIEKFEEQAPAPSNADWIGLGNSILDIAYQQAARFSEKSSSSS